MNKKTCIQYGHSVLQTQTCHFSKHFEITFLAQHPDKWTEVVMFKVLRLEPHYFLHSNDILLAFSYTRYSKSVGDIEQFASNKVGCRHVKRWEGTHFW
jgi:hypothetical protein